MNIVARIRQNFTNIITTITRFSLTTILLIIIAFINGIEISNSFEKYSSYILTLIVGAIISIVAQQLYERYFVRKSTYFLLQIGAIIFTILYYFAIGSVGSLSVEQSVKTAVISFALLMAFIWIPSIKSKLTFNESFLATFKAFFITILFSVVILGGVNLIILAIDSLLFSVDFKVYAHATNIIVSLFAPLLFLSLIPHYLGKQDETVAEEDLQERITFIEKAVSCPKHLANLISYVIIPLVGVYTVILLVYIAFNLTGAFWAENLMEPLLVSYSITVIIVYILASNLDDRFSNIFRKIFPKVLVVIVAFQTVASILKITEAGMTHGRYYVIMFGVFALLSGLIFSFSSIRKNGHIVAILLIFSLVSIVPPVDAFTVSKTNQLNKLKAILIENNMLENNKIIPNENLSVENKVTITKTVNYLQTLGYDGEINWLPANVNLFDQFSKTFGFNEIFDPDLGEQVVNKYVTFNIYDNPAINISKYDFMTSLYAHTGSTSNLAVPIKTEYGKYKLTQEKEENDIIVKLLSEEDDEIINFNLGKIIDELILNNEDNITDNELTTEQATFTTENEQAILTILTNSINFYGDDYDLDLYVFIKIK